MQYPACPIPCSYMFWLTIAVLISQLSDIEEQLFRTWGKCIGLICDTGWKASVSMSFTRVSPPITC